MGRLNVLLLSMCLFACTHKSKEERLLRIMNESLLLRERYDVEEQARIRGLENWERANTFDCDTFNIRDEDKFVPLCFLFTPTKDTGVCIYASKGIAWTQGGWDPPTPEVPKIIYRYYWIAFHKQNKEWVPICWPLCDCDESTFRGRGFYSDFFFEKKYINILTREEMVRLLFSGRSGILPAIPSIVKELIRKKYWFDIND